MISRRQFLAASGATALTPLVTSCQIAGLNLSVYKPPTIKGEYISIDQDTVLDQDQFGKHFVVREGVTLDLNGYSLDGIVGSAYVDRAFRLYDGARITNGTVKNYRSGGYAANQMPSGYLDALMGVSKDEAALIGIEYRAQASRGQKIDSLIFRDMINEAFYVQAFVTDATIEDCEFHDSGTMHIYVDHGSADNTIQNNYLGPCGKNHVTGREGIALDACIGTDINNNVFDGYMANGCINIFTNWGENGITREIACDNRIFTNLFQDNWRGISIASRYNRKAAGHTGPDYAERNSVFDNLFVDIPLPVEDLGENNIVTV